MWRSSSSTPSSTPPTPPNDPHGTPSSFSHYPDTPPTPSSWTGGPTLPAFNLNFLPSIPSFFGAGGEEGGRGGGEERLTELPEKVIKREAKGRSYYDAKVSSLDLGGFGGYSTSGGGGRGDYEQREAEIRREEVDVGTTTAPNGGGGGGWRDYFLARGVIPEGLGSPHDSEYPETYGTSASGTATGSGGSEQKEWKSKSQRESTQYLLGKGGRPFSYDTTGTGRQPLMMFRNEGGMRGTDDEELGEVEKGLERSGSYRSHRSRKSSLSLPTLALISGFLTLLNVLWSGFVIFEAVYGLVNYGPQDATGMAIMRWVSVGVGAVAVADGMITIGWLQFRHPTALSLPVLIFTTLIFVLHLALSLANFALIFIWYPTTLKFRCTWGIDPVWILGTVGEVCEEGGANLGAWAIAAGIRVLIVIIVGSALLLFLRHFHRSLTPPELPAETSNSAHPDRLPAMPDHSEFYSLDTSSSLGAPAKEVGWASWIGGKVLGKLAWLVGLDAPEEVAKEKPRESERDVEKVPFTGRSVSEEMRERENVRMGMGSESLPGQRGTFLKPMQPISWEMPPTQEQQPAIAVQQQFHDPRQQQYRDYQQQQYYSSRPPYFQHHADNDEASRPLFQPSPALKPDLVHPPALQPHYSPTASSYLETPASAYRNSFRAPSPPSQLTSLMLAHENDSQDQYEEEGGDRRDYDDVEEVDLDRTPPSASSSRFPTGSSGSTGGAYVYVRMSDGKLVRKLSTIVSESSAGNWGAEREGSAGRRPGGRPGRERTTSSGTTGSSGSEPKSPGWRKKVPNF